MKQDLSHYKILCETGSKPLHIIILLRIIIVIHCDLTFVFTFMNVDTSLSTILIKHSDDIPKLRRDRNIAMQ